MNSSKFEEIARLLDKTERNLKRIERIDDSFVSFAINEWRYATRHVIAYMQSGSAEEECKVVGHLKRAYFDSSEVLLDGLLDRIAKYELYFRGYSGIVAAIVPGFKEAYLKVWEAKELLAKAQAYDLESREVKYDRLEPYCDALEAFVENLEKSRNAWQDDIRVQKRRDRMPIIWSAIGIAVSIILAIIFT